MKNILLAVDLSQDDKLLLDYAEQFAKKFNSKVWIVHITSPEPEFMGYDYGLQYIRDVRANELRTEHKQVQEYADRFRNMKVESEALLIQGLLIERIIEEAVKLNINLIILGSHEHGFLYNALIGSTSAQILRKSKIPILVIPIE